VKEEDRRRVARAGSVPGWTFAVDVPRSSSFVQTDDDDDDDDIVSYSVPSVPIYVPSFRHLNERKRKRKSGIPFEEFCFPRIPHVAPSEKKARKGRNPPVPTHIRNQVIPPVRYIHLVCHLCGYYPFLRAEEMVIAPHRRPGRKTCLPLPPRLSERDRWRAPCTT
jgi:hypothetical protein